MGKHVCAKHNEAYETECRWCAPPLPQHSDTYEAQWSAARLQELMNEAWAKITAATDAATARERK